MFLLLNTPHTKSVPLLLPPQWGQGAASEIKLEGAGPKGPGLEQRDRHADVGLDSSMQAQCSPLGYSTSSGILEVVGE